MAESKVPRTKAKRGKRMATCRGGGLTVQRLLPPTGRLHRKIRRPNSRISTGPCTLLHSRILAKCLTCQASAQLVPQYRPQKFLVAQANNESSASKASGPSNHATKMVRKASCCLRYRLQAATRHKLPANRTSRVPLVRLLA